MLSLLSSHQQHKHHDIITDSLPCQFCVSFSQLVDCFVGRFGMKVAVVVVVTTTDDNVYTNVRLASEC